MTLIAGFEAHGVPILLGDFLISTRARPSGLSKKVHRISPTLVIAWTDHYLGAKYVLKKLHGRFRRRTPSRQLLEQCLTAYNEGDLLNVRLIGWILDGEPYCFSWSSWWPKEVFYGAPSYDGSGGPLIGQFVGSGNIHDATEPNLIDTNRAIETSLTFTTYLMMDEILGGDNRNLGFGYAYELLYLDKDRFRYIDNILYTVLTFELDNNDNILNYHISDLIYKYHRYKKHSVIQTFRHGVPNEHTVDIVAPIGISEKDIREGQKLLRRINNSKNYPFPFASDYYCIFFGFLAPGYISPLTAVVLKAGTNTDPFIEVRNGQYINFQFPSDIVHFVYRSVRDDSTQLQSPLPDR